MNKSKCVEIVWPITDSHTLRARLGDVAIGCDEHTRRCIARIVQPHGNEDNSPMHERIAQWLADQISEEIGQAEHALARTLVYNKEEARFSQNPTQETRLGGAGSLSPEEHADDAYRIEHPDSTRRSAHEGASRAIRDWMEDWLFGEGGAMYALDEVMNRRR